LGRSTTCTPPTACGANTSGAQISAPVWDRRALRIRAGARAAGRFLTDGGSEVPTDYLEIIRSDHLNAVGLLREIMKD